MIHTLVVCASSSRLRCASSSARFLAVMSVWVTTAPPCRLLRGTTEINHHRLSEELPESTEIWVGGIGSADVVREIKATRATYLKDLAAFEQKLIRTGAHF